MSVRKKASEIYIGSADTIPGCARVANQYHFMTSFAGQLQFALMLVFACSFSAWALPHSKRVPIPPVNTSDYEPVIFSGNENRFERFNETEDEKLNYKDLTLSHQRQSRLLDIKTHLKANYLDSAGRLDDTETVMKINSLYIDASVPQQHVSARLGRHSPSMAGTNYALDGMSMSYRLFNKHRINMLAGYEHSDADEVDVNTDKSIVGISAESARFGRYWHADAYAFEQQNAGIVDRKIIGSRLRFLDAGQSASLQFDVDSAQFESHSSQLMVKLNPYKNQSVQLALDYRSPGATSGLIVPALDELLKSLADEEIKALEQDTDAVIRSGALSWKKELSNELSLNSEVSVSSLSKSALAGALSTDSYYLYGVQLTGKNFINIHDTASMSLRYLDYSTASRVSLSINNRTPFRPNWHADWQLDAYWQENDNETQTVGLSPLLKLQYKQKDNTQLDVELGVKHFDAENDIDGSENNDVFINITHTKALW